MDEQTATVTVSMSIKLTGEQDGDNFITAEEKAQNVAQIIRDQKEAIKRTYDTGVEVTGTLKYSGNANEAL